MTEIIDAENYIPSSPDDRKKIKEAIIEASGLKQRQKDLSDQIKDIVDFIHDFGVPKKVARSMINTYHKNNYNEVTVEAALFEVAYENIIGSNQ